MSAAIPEPPRRPASTRPHQVHRFLGRLHEVLDEVSADTIWALSPEELAACVEEAYAAQARLSALTLALVAQADRIDLATHDGAISLTAWLREHVRLAPAEAKRQIKLATALEHHDVARTALEAGSFPPASAAVITATLDTFPADVDADVVGQAEEYLTGEAHTHDTGTLRRLADHLDEVIDPDGADQRLADALARAEARAARQAFLHLRHDELTATTEGTFRIPLLSGVKLQRMIESLTNPGRPDPIDTVDPDTGHRLSAEERRGRALCALIDRYPTKRLPKLGSSNPTVVVTMSLETLMGGLEAAHVDTGQVIGPGLARRLAAQGGMIPMVLGTDSQVLDMGQLARFVTAAQRLALGVQQGGTCAADACPRPAVGADGAHLIAWSQGGRTDLKDLALLCTRHHTLADHPDYRVERLRPGRIRIHRRC